MVRTRLGWRRAGVAVGVVAALAAVGGWLLLRHAPAAGPVDAPLVGTAAPPLAGRTLAGGSLDLAQLRGEVVVVNVWAAWCAPCREELPLLVATGDRSPGRGLRLVGIDTRDGERQARELLAAVGGDPRSVVVDPDGRIARDWQVRGVPESFVVDPTGTVRAHRVGPVTRAWLDAAVEPLLAGG